VFTLNVGPASRSRNGSWNPSNTESLLAYTAQQDYRVAVWELGNELNASWAVHGWSTQFPPRQYHDDLESAQAWVNRLTPGASLAGQSSAFFPILGEPLNGLFRYMPDYLRRSGELVDIVSWHYYPQQSRRAPGASRRAFPSRMLDPANLDEAAYWGDRMREWRDRYAPGRPLWLGETGNAQVGGEPGLSDVYLGTLWWLDQLGLLARHGHDVMIRHTLVGSDYGMLELDTEDRACSLAPRPDYWGSLLWRRLMGQQVYAVTTEGDTKGKLRAYAHSVSGAGDGISLLVLNLDHESSVMLSLPELAGRSCEVYALSAPDLFGKTLLLNGAPLELRGGRLPKTQGIHHTNTLDPAVTLPPLGCAFLAFS
jgi:heparanase